jgi:hypothetical protein
VESQLAELLEGEALDQRLAQIGRFDVFACLRLVRLTSSVAPGRASRRASRCRFDRVRWRWSSDVELAPARSQSWRSA